MGKIDILGLPFTVIQASPVSHSDSLAGLCEANHLRITIDSNISPDFKCPVLLHEVIHAILNNLGSDEKFSDEQFVTPLAAALWQFLNANGLVDIDKWKSLLE